MALSSNAVYMRQMSQLYKQYKKCGGSMGWQNFLSQEREIREREKKLREIDC